MGLTGKVKKCLLNKKILLGFVLILSLTFIQYSRGYRFYFLFLFLFFFVQIALKKRSFLFLTIFVFSIALLKTPALDILLVFKEQSLDIVSQPKKTLRTILGPNMGEEVLPHEVRSMLYLLRKHEVSDYGLSISLERDPLIFQRMVEAAWNLQYQNASQYIFYREEEISEYLICDSLDQEGVIYLAYCP